MSFWSDIFGNSSTATSSTQSTSQGTSSTQTLDAATMAMLEKLLPGLMGAVGNNNAAADSNAIRALAAQVGDTKSLNANIDAGISASDLAANQAFQTGAGATARTFASMTGGGKGNTFGNLVTNNSNADLQAQLMQIMTSGKIQEGQLDTQAREGAAGLYSEAGQTQVAESAGPLDNLAKIIAMLKGGNVTSSFSQSGTSDTQGSQTSSPGLMGALQEILSL